MRLHISLDEAVVAEIDRLAAPRGRSDFIAGAVERALDRERRWRSFESIAGSVADRGHDWDADPAAWVRAQRRADPRRVG